LTIPENFSTGENFRSICIFSDFTQNFAIIETCTKKSIELC